MSKPRTVAKVTAEYDGSTPIEITLHEQFAAITTLGINGKPLTFSEAYRRLYPKSQKWKPDALWTRASQLADNHKVVIRRRWLMQQAASSRIADLTERKEVLTEIVRGRMHHFGTVGADGFVPNIGPENANSAALEEVTSRTVISGEGDGKDDAVIQKVKLRDPIAAIKELNAMEGVYPRGTGDTGNTLVLIFQGNRGKKGPPAPIRMSATDVEVKPKGVKS